MTDLNKVIASMSNEARSKAEAYASSKNITLEQAVAHQLDLEVSDSDLDSVSGGGIPIEAPVEADVEKDIF